MKFKSKVDWWMWAIFWAFTITTILLTWLLVVGERNAEAWMSAIIFWIFEFSLMMPLFLGTYYYLDNDNLLVQ